MVLNLFFSFLYMVQQNIFMSPFFVDFLQLKFVINIFNNIFKLLLF